MYEVGFHFLFALLTGVLYLLPLLEGCESSALDGDCDRGMGKEGAVGIGVNFAW